MKKLTALALAAALIFALAGCGADDGLVEYDWDEAWESYAPDTTVMTVNGEEISWEQYFYWLYLEYMQYFAGLGMDEPVSEENDTPVSEFLASDVESYVVQYAVIDQLAREHGVELTAEDEEVLAAQLESDIAEYAGEGGTEEELFDYLEGIHVSREVYDYVNRVMVLYPRMFMELYGSSGEKYSDEDTLAYAAEYGYVTAKHILFKTTDDENEPLPEAEIEEIRARAEAVLSELQNAPEGGLEALFDELMAEYSDDPGSESYPDGYCFEPGAPLVQEFKDAAAKLEPGEISGLVESSYGLHILLREPVRSEDLVLMQTAQPFTLRYTAAVMDYNNLYNSAIMGAEVVYAEGFEGFRPADLFAA